MRVHVKCEIVNLVERLVTDDTFVGLIDAVGQFVILVIALLVETLAAVFAYKRLESGVNAHVRIERRRPVERFTARRTLVRFLGRVNNFVTAQSRCLPESLTAHFADERPGSCMHWHVSRQIVMGVEHFTAIGAGKNAILVAAAPADAVVIHSTAVDGIAAFVVYGVIFGTIRFDQTSASFVIGYCRPIRSR